MKIAVACDHAGFEYKERIRQFLKERNHEDHDFGTSSTDRVDYPDFIRPAALAVRDGGCDCGIVLRGSGNGEAIVANRLTGIRCALCWNTETARLARRHNNANMLSLGQRMTDWATAEQIIGIWLSTPFNGGRHTERIRKIDAP